ncbi:glycine zipper 2TM domain-containing protein [Shewanella sp. Isolate11]|uniref:glycine zipper 2TM domain-containing protein n=1 Tax=Shewanella sp. Isolate11 TaxID=2908530 RepID=UPI001EFE7772|nr:glycine zipper 2TM domain-containing protein [Shewanella sp. Isolate11]MCG9697004.1 glycine zipper 2TM domain-containing protein [Shewanella sp. Isolate11]
MLKPRVHFFRFISLIFVASCFAGIPSVVNAAYERNKAVPVEKVVYGYVNSVRNISQSQLVEDQHRGWKMFGGALLGGVIGHQFGGGSGRDVATVLGALLGAGAGSHYSRDYLQQLKLVELLITFDSGEQVMVLQDFDPAMVFNTGDQVRVIYLKGSVRVDLAM